MSRKIYQIFIANLFESFLFLDLCLRDTVCYSEHCFSRARQIISAKDFEMIRDLFKDRSPFKHIPREGFQLLIDEDLATTIYKPRNPSWVATSILMILTAILTALTTRYSPFHGHVDVDDICARRTMTYSPIIDEVGVHYTPSVFNGSLMLDTIYKHDGSPEVDAAWDAFGLNYLPIKLSEDQALRAGLTSGVHLKYKDEFGGGYPALIKGFHHVHCLNLLRQSLYWNFGHYQAEHKLAFGDDFPLLKHHIHHCLDSLRQLLLCEIDVGVYGYVWFHLPGDRLRPTFDFNSTHKCRNFEEIREWSEKSQYPSEPLAEEAWMELLEQPKEGDKVWRTFP
ncbi:hypothetical protein FB567DRAFT_596604 [Paraphoma chrysanthemicola]|uniref:Tat pathway signal sequence n=1 Tax=Paraphoma chrysanthemicola TaxID=798071 RepID=A0A8K0QYC8_9PLEO|nr:hypothetical protein FB567DRAFT_596604 [Paraphoma chrysanthemicola]